MGWLARPGGNATGFTCISTDLGSKRLGLLKACCRRASALAVLYSEPDTLEPELQQLEAQARQIGLTVARFPVRSPAGFRANFQGDGGQEERRALYRRQQFREPTSRPSSRSWPWRTGYRPSTAFASSPQAGGLMTYGAPLQDGFRRAAHQIDKILKGASPSDVPLEQPTRFELVLNVKTAKALGLDVPAGLLVQADELIE